MFHEREVDMVLRYIVLLIVLCTSAPLWAETDSVSLRVPPDQAVFIVRYQPEGDQNSDEVEDARDLYTKVSSEILSLQMKGLHLDLIDYQPVLHRKISSSPHTCFICKVTIDLCTDTINCFWGNSLIVSQVMAGLSNVSQKVKGLSWTSPEYGVKKPDKFLPTLYRLLRQRVQVVSSDLFDQLKPDQVTIEPYALKVAGSELSSVTVELPFRLNLQYGKTRNGS